MLHYKGWIIYNVSGFISDKWRVQGGYEILGDYKTLGAAKGAITKNNKKVDI